MYKTIQNIFTKYKTDEAGNFSIMFAVSMIALVTGVAAAIEFNSLYSQKETLQRHLDAALLAVVSSGIDKKDDQLEYVKKYIKENSYGIELKTVKIDHLASSEVVLSATIKPDFYFSGVLGIVPSIAADSAAFAGEAEVINSVDLVMVLDTTESMDGAKIIALRQAANTLIDTIPDGGDVQVGIVPFSNYVNVGLNNRNAPWINVDPDYSTVETYNRRTKISGPTCRGSGENVDIRDGVAYTSSGNVCNSYNPAVYGPSTQETRTVDYVWEGCVFSRHAGNRDLHLSDDQYDIYKINGRPRGSCGEALLPLTNKKADMTAHINSLVVDEDTYMPAGIMWGRRVLSSHEPFTGGRKAEGVRQVMLLMTDGQNSMHRWGQSHNSSDANDPQDVELLAKTNEDTHTLCTLAKTDQIEVYSIAFEVNDIVTRNLLKGCASELSMFYDAQNSSQLLKAFEDISGKLSESASVRLTR